MSAIRYGKMMVKCDIIFYCRSLIEKEWKMNEYITLGIASCFPMIAAVIIYKLDEKTSFGALGTVKKQIIIGLVFGLLAISGTEFGIPINGAQVNVRDAAVLTAGLIFGGPAGIIAGLIGGIERWFAVYWGIGTFTRVACTVATIFAGIFAAILRKYMFEGKRPDWMITFAIGIVVEVFHLTMVFVTNMNDTDKAMTVVQSCSFPMIIANGVSVLLAAMAITFISGDKFFKERHRTVSISTRVQRAVLITVSIAFVMTSLFVFSLQNSIARDQTDSMLSISNDEAYLNIRDASDASLLSIVYLAATEAEENGIDSAIEKYGLKEVNIVDKKNKIIDTNVKEYIGFDMNSGEQSSEFMKNVWEKKEYVQQYGAITSDNDIKRKYAGVVIDDKVVQVGYSADQIQESISEKVIGATRNSHVGATGYVIIMDEDYDIVSAPETMEKALSDKERSIIEKAEKGKTFRTVLNGEGAYCQVLPAEGYCIMSVLPAEEALRTRNIALYVNSFMEILIFGILFFILYMIIKQIVVSQIKSVNRSLKKITGGDLSEKVDVRSSREFEYLSDDINSTVDTLKDYIAQASARIDQELEVARNIQKSALPNTDKAYSDRTDFEICATMEAAKEVGGDFYDFYMTEDEILNFVIADVSGKGIPAAMFMMRAKTELQGLTEAGYPLDVVFTEGNNVLCEGNDAGMFVTAWQGNIDLENGSIRFANAGHNPPLIQREDGTFEYLKSKAGFILAGMEDVPYRVQEEKLTPGSVIFLYTDGVTEATNEHNELYGEKRLLRVLNAGGFEDMKDLCSRVKADVDDFVGEAPQFDDITMVALKYIGKPEIVIEEAVLSDINVITEFVEEKIGEMGASMNDIISINVAIDEIVNNIISYGYEKPGKVTVRLIERKNPHRVDIIFIDEGIPYNPVIKDDPDTTLSAEDRQIGGLGIFIVKKTMDGMKYRYEDDQNILTLTKIFN